MHRLEDLHDLLRRLRVEVARRLVGHDDVRVVDERPRDGDALALAARELIWQVVGTVLEADGLEEVHGALRALPVADACVDERQGDVLERRDAREQVEVLEDEPDLLVARPREGIVVEAGDLLPVKLVGALRRAVEAAEDVHERRLARAGRPHQSGELALVDIRRDAVERGELLAADVIDFLDAVELYCRIPLFCLFLSCHRTTSEHGAAAPAAGRRARALLLRSVRADDVLALLEPREDLDVLIAVDARRHIAVLL